MPSVRMSVPISHEAPHISAGEAESIFRAAAAIVSCTVHDSTGRMVKDEVGASIATYPTLLAATLLAKSSSSLDAEFVGAVASNAFIHLGQLISAHERGAFGHEDLAAVLALGPLVSTNDANHGRVARPAASLSDGIAGEEFTVATPGGRFAKRLEQLGFTRDSITEHYHAGRRALIQVGDSIGVRAALSAALALEEEPLWAPIGDVTGIPTGPSRITVSPASWCAGTIVVAGLPAPRDGWPSPLDHGALQVRMDSRVRGYEFTPESFVAYQGVVRDQSAVHLGCGHDVPAWTAYLDRLICPAVTVLPVAIAGQCKVTRDEKDQIRLVTPAPWSGPDWQAVNAAVRSLPTRSFHADDPPYWSFPNDQRGVLLDRLRGPGDQAPSIRANTVIRLLEDPILGPIPAVARAEAGGVTREGNVYTSGPVVVTETTTGNLIISIPPPWTPGWDKAKDEIKGTEGRNFLAASKMWSIPMREAAGLAERIIGDDLDAAAPAQHLVAILRHPDLGNAFRAKYAGHDEKIAYLWQLASQDVASAAFMERLGAVLPPNLKPLNFQGVGIEWLEQLGGRGMLADDMGLGKTIQSICYTLLDRNERFPVLVVAPANARSNWVKEYRTWGARNPPEIAEANGRTPTAAELDAVSKADVTVVNYDILQEWAEVLRARGFKTMILDEAHYVKNPEAKRTQLIQELAGSLGGASALIPLTGTPMPNRARELAPLLQLTRAEAFPEQMTFFVDHCIVGRGTHGALWGKKDATGLHRLLTRGRSVDEADAKHPPCMPIMIRRLKNNVLDLPPKTVTKVNVTAPANAELAEHMAKMIETLRKAPTPNHQLAIINQARHFAGVLKAPVVAERAIELVNEGEAVVVFVHHADVLDAIKRSLDDASVHFGVINGEVTPAKRKKLCEDFQDEKFPVMLCSQAGREAITLTRSRRLIIAEREWVPGYEVQAEDRIYRIGQKRAVGIEYPHLTGSIDDHLGMVVDLKKGDIDAVMNGLVDDSEENPSIMQQVLDSLLTTGTGVPHSITS